MKPPTKQKESKEKFYRNKVERNFNGQAKIKGCEEFRQQQVRICYLQIFMASINFPSNFFYCEIAG